MTHKYKLKQKNTWLRGPGILIQVSQTYFNLFCFNQNIKFKCNIMTMNMVALKVKNYICKITSDYGSESWYNLWGIPFGDGSRMSRKIMRRIEVPIDTPTEFELENTAAGMQRRREEREQREEPEKRQRRIRSRKPGGRKLRSHRGGSGRKKTKN